MRRVADADPIGQFVGERIAIVKKAAGLDHEPPRVRPRPPGHPADRPDARQVGDDFDGAADMRALDVLRDRSIVDPAIAVTDHFVPTLDERAGEPRMLLERACDREHADLDGEVAEYVQQTPDAAAAAILENSSASRIEFAHVQYYGWAFANRDQLLPTREQLMHSLDFFKQTQERLRGKIKVEYVVPDYYAKFPKPCMGGWARKVILITPSGAAMPCHAASVIPGLRFDNVKEKSVKEIWKSGEAFKKSRGEHWMHDPGKPGAPRPQDFGACRCQAFLLAGDAAATDPVCSLSPQRSLIDAALAATPVPQVAGSHASPQSPLTMVQPRWLYRTNPR